MKQLLILGAGGMGKEIFYTARHSIGYGTEFVVKGFLDFPNPDWDTTIYPPIIGLEDDYEIQPDDVFTCSIGDVHLKRKVCEKMKARGAKFQTLIFNNAQIGDNVTIGDGCIIDPYARVGADVILGENCLVQTFAILGHESKIGDYCRLDCRSLLVGGVQVEDNVTVHTNAVVSHKVVLGHDSIVAAMSFVIRSVKAGTTVMGNPAKRLEY
jgi:sugar O-acyltransferase (sialic acid O-acetyltransferase NeuD family)